MTANYGHFGGNFGAAWSNLKELEPKMCGKSAEKKFVI